MIGALGTLIRRELMLAFGLGGGARGSAGFVMPIIFFLAVATIYPSRSAPMRSCSGAPAAG